MNKWRRFIIYPIVQFSCRILLHLLGYYYIPTYGEIASLNETSIIICNHSCILEGWLLFYHYGCSPVGAKEFLEIPIMGTILEALQLISIDRYDPDSRAKVQKEIFDRTSNSNWGRLLIFPEGACGNGKSLLQFKVGPFAPGKPVQPVVFRYHEQDHFHPSFVAAGPSSADVLLRSMCEPINWMSMYFLPVYSPNESEILDAKLFANNVRKKMAETLRIPVSNFGFEDVKFQGMGVKKNSVRPEHTALELSLVMETLKIKILDCHLLMDTFHRIDTERNNQVSYNQFINFFGFDIENPYAINLCKLLDNEEYGYIKFRNFVLGLGVLLSDNEKVKIFELAFKILDVEQSGLISVKLLQDIYKNYIPNSERTIVQAFSSLNGLKEVNQLQFNNLANNNPLYLTVFRHNFKLHKVEESVEPLPAIASKPNLLSKSKALNKSDPFLNFDTVDIDIISKESKYLKYN